MRTWLPLLLALVGCKDEAASPPAVELDYTEARAACVDRDANRHLYWGDLHVHTGFSFDARNYGNVLTPDDAYRFAQGDPVLLPPLDDTGKGTRSTRIDRPLDFVGVTDHGEFLGEIFRCTTPSAEGFDSNRCARYRDPRFNGAFDFALPLSMGAPERFPEVCGDAPMSCAESAALRWGELQDAAEAHYDRSEACTFTTFVGYEYTNTMQVSNLHRNVIFRNAQVPALPITHFEAPHPLDLWTQLDAQCTGECDVLVLPHNANLSNGRLFTPDAPPGREAEVAAIRARMEPVVEIFQHKGDSECRRGLSGFGATDDPDCDFEKLRAEDAVDCGDVVGAGGMRLWGCVHRLDFVRNVLKLGLAEGRRWGTNPYRLGFIGSTDTHNGTPGHVRSADFPGHVGVVDATSEGRLGRGNVTHDAKINNPGGLAAVWAVENSRDALFEAVRRRETYATSGPRIKLRFFAVPDAQADWCDAPDRVAQAYASGVPMGGEIEGAPAFLIEAEADEAGLDGVQVVRGWIDAEGGLHERVIDIIPTTADAPSECVPAAARQRLCVRWQDPDPPTSEAFYYVRVLEVPTCRWSRLECAGLSGERPAACAPGVLPDSVRQRAWSSPIWTR